jgi:glucose-6-phosphate 1-dehydrogenase
MADAAKQAAENKAKEREQRAARREKLQRVNSMVTELLDQMRSDNPPDPIHFLTQRLNSDDFSNLSTDSPAESPEKGVPRYPKELDARPLTIIVLGASGDLAKKKTFPALFSLFRKGLLPPCTSIVGYARSELSMKELIERVSPNLPKHVLGNDKENFWSLVSYCSGNYDAVGDFKKLDEHIKEREKGVECAEKCTRGGNRVFYLALPPSAFVDACKGISGGATPKDGWMRVVVEKPFGHDTESSHQLAKDLRALLQEEQLFRIDHYLGKEMVQNLVTLRFANHVFGAVWDRSHICNVQITFKETIGTEGRGGYFDKYGIIRDVMQNHLTQILALLTMEKPKSLDGEAIRDEKVAVLKAVRPVRLEDCVIGQYTAKPDGSEPGYLEDPGVPKGSNCPTFASMVLHVNNDRWAGVPFIMKAGKALNEKVVVIRIQFREEIQPFGDATTRNELVIRAQPDEAMYLKIMTKAPGLGKELTSTELDLTYKERFEAVSLPEAYESLINEVVIGNPTNFVRSDELDAAWQIFTPLLHRIDKGELKPIPYPMGSRGPEQADDLAAQYGFVRNTEYRWSKHKAKPDEKPDNEQRKQEKKVGQAQAAKQEDSKK